MKRCCPYLVILVLTLALDLLATAVIAVADASRGASMIPSGGRPLLPGDWTGRAFWVPRSDPGRAETTIANVQGMPFRKAVSTRTFKRPLRPWDVLIGARLSGDIEKGDVCLLTFSARGRAIEKQNGLAHADVYIELSSRSHTKLLSYPVDAGSEWRTYYVPFEAKERLPDGSAQVVFHLGFSPQTMDVGGMSMLNFGKTRAFVDLPHTPISYDGRNPDAAWRKAALERIDRIRKAPLTVEVVDAEGKPLEGARVHIRMLRHAFGFGSAVGANLLGVNLEDTETVKDYFLDYGGSRDIRIYRETVEKLFNKAVFENDLKFVPWTDSQSNRHSNYRKEWTDRAFAWLRERSMTVRGHWIACGALEDYPRELVYGSRSLFRSRLFASIRDKVPEIGKRVAEWDAVNHLVDGEENLAAHFGSPDIYVEIMKLSRDMAPGIELWVNEGHVLAEGSRRDTYEKLIRYLIDRAAAPDGIGFMGHFDLLSLTPPEEALRVMDRFANIIPNIQITEMDVDAGGDEQLQADYFRDMLIAAFSHAACKGIMIWGFWERRHWKPAAALFRADWSIKPAGQVWKDLVLHQWWTDVEAQADGQGRCTLSGFLGDYELSGTWRDKKGSTRLSLPKGGATAKIVME